MFDKIVKPDIVKKGCRTSCALIPCMMDLLMIDKDVRPLLGKPQRDDLAYPIIGFIFVFQLSVKTREILKVEKRSY